MHVRLNANCCHEVRESEAVNDCLSICVHLMDW